MVFLVGGLGTRLGARSRDLPKPLQPVVGKPLLEHLMDYARGFGVRRFLLLAGHLGDIVREKFASDDVEILIEPAPLGTGGALRFAREKLDETFLMANGDSFFGIDLFDLAQPPQGDWQGKLALRRVADASRYGVVDLAGARITGFQERGPAAPALINGGVYLLRREIAERIGEGPQSIERDVFPGLAREGLLLGKEYDGPFIDIGIPDDLDRAQAELPGMLAAARKR